MQPTQGQIWIPSLTVPKNKMSLEISLKQIWLMANKHKYMNNDMCEKTELNFKSDSFQKNWSEGRCAVSIVSDCTWLNKGILHVFSAVKDKQKTSHRGKTDKKHLLLSCLRAWGCTVDPTARKSLRLNSTNTWQNCFCTDLLFYESRFAAATGRWVHSKANAIICLAGSDADVFLCRPMHLSFRWVI